MERVRIPIKNIRNLSVLDDINGEGNKFDYIVIHPDDIRTCIFKAKSSVDIYYIRIKHLDIGNLDLEFDNFDDYKAMAEAIGPALPTA